MRLSEDEREELAGRLLDSVEPPPGISVDDTEELERRAAEARSGAPGIPWDEIKRELLPSAKRSCARRAQAGAQHPRQ